MRIIDIPYDFTSYEFYSNIMPQILSAEGELLLDFSFTRRIESLVIPNLLCLANIMQRDKEIIPELFIPDTTIGGTLKNYLNEIEFTKYATRGNLYRFTYDPYGGLSGKKIGPLCGTLSFNASHSYDAISRGVKLYVLPFSDQYLSDFQTYDDEKAGFVNEISMFLEELLTNCKDHAKSFSITTLHANYAAKKIYIAVSDVGRGFLNTIENCYVQDEKMAILAGVYCRKDSKIYGLYNVIKSILGYGGKVRIHSNDTQIIFTPRILKEFVSNQLINDYSFEKYNVKKTAQFDGVHIEIELPWEGGTKNENYR